MSNEDSPATGSDHTSPQTISLIAGLDPDGRPVMENIFVAPVEAAVPPKMDMRGSNGGLRAPNSIRAGLLANDHDNAPKDGKEFRLLKSPAFVRGVAAGDRIRYPVNNDSGYTLVKRSGNLSIRVLRKEAIDDVAMLLTPELELLDGTLDLQSQRLLVYSIHVSIGFQQIEALLDRAAEQFPGVVWYYGNVYDPADGLTPLTWWQEFLAPV